MTPALLDSRLTAYQPAPRHLPSPPRKRNQSKLIRQNRGGGGGGGGGGGRVSSPSIQNIFPASLPPSRRGEITGGYLSGVKQLHLSPTAALAPQSLLAAATTATTATVLSCTCKPGAAADLGV